MVIWLAFLVALLLYILLLLFLCNNVVVETVYEVERLCMKSGEVHTDAGKPTEDCSCVQDYQYGYETTCYCEGELCNKAPTLNISVTMIVFSVIRLLH